MFHLLKEALKSLKREGLLPLLVRIQNYLIHGKGSLTIGRGISSLSKLPIKKDLYEQWIKKTEIKYKKFIKKNHKRITQELDYKPLISIIMPVYNSDEIFLRRAIFSVVTQYYQNWELIIINDNSTLLVIEDVLEEFPNRDKRIKIIKTQKNSGISKASNLGISKATGTFLGFLDHDDLLEPETLLENVRLLNKNKDLDLIYSDDDKINRIDNRYDPQFKPDWSPELLLSYCYISHFKLIRKKTLEKAGLFREKYDGSQDYDLLLRASEITSKIGHIPKILYHWRATENSTALNSNLKPKSVLNGKLALNDALKRRGIAGKAIIPRFAKERNLGIFKIKYNLDSSQKISIIIPTKDNFLILKKCINSIIRKTTYRNYKIFVIDNGSTKEKKLIKSYCEKNKVTLIRIKTKTFNYSLINNLAVKDHIKDEFILFLNNDTEVISKNWLQYLLGTMLINKKIGACGARLIFPNKKIQHGGVVMGLNEGAGHANKNLPFNELGYLNYNLVMRNYSAVTGACLMTRRSYFLKVGGFDQKNLKVAYSDIDYCLKLEDEGLRTVYNPNALLFHHEGYTRKLCEDPKELSFFQKKWQQKIKKDPYYNKNLSLKNEFFEIKQ